MGNKIEVPEIYEKVINNLNIGIHQSRFYIKNDQNWKPITQMELAVRIRALFHATEQKFIAVKDVKEVIDRLMQIPALQKTFVEDVDENYIKLKHGIFNVNTGKIEVDEDLDFGYCLDFDYLEQEKRNMSNFDAFVNSVFPTETEAKKELLLEILGYVISDYTSAKAGFFLIGESNSGKSTMLELLKKILPEQSVTTIPLYRLENRFNLARLSESKVNISMELSEKSFAATDIFKMLTSNEVVTAEHKGGKPFEFRLRCKTINAGNLIPEIKNSEGVDAIVNRMIVLLFPISIPKEKQDLELLDKLWSERNSIFSEALDRLTELKKRRFIFVEPSDSIKLKKHLREQGNTIAEFLGQCCEFDKDGRVHFAALYKEYKSYCEENLLDMKHTKAQFSQCVKGLQQVTTGKFRINGGKPLAGVLGLKLKTQFE